MEPMAFGDSSQKNNVFQIFFIHMTMEKILVGSTLLQTFKYCHK